MISGLDSANPPTSAQVAQAKAAGIRLWAGYLATKPGVGLLRPWSKEEFNVARQCGATPIAYCSGNDDPEDCAALAHQWDVRLCLDVESRIRGDGAWVQPWLNASGAGLYGNSSVFAGRVAPFFVLAGYYGYDPKTTWKGTAPSIPHAWQWQGTHTEFGVSVDSTYFDDWFAQGEDDMTPEEHALLQENHNRLENIEKWTSEMNTIIKEIQQKVGTGSGAVDLDAIAKAVADELHARTAS